MKSLQLVGLNEYTDSKEYELVIRKVESLIWGFYRNANSGGTISDSQFNIFHRNIGLEDDNLQEELKEKFGFYTLFSEMSIQY